MISLSSVVDIPVIKGLLKILFYFLILNLLEVYWTTKGSPTLILEVRKGPSPTVTKYEALLVDSASIVTIG